MDTELLKKKGLELSLGFSHPIIIDEVPGIKFTVEKYYYSYQWRNRKEVVGQVAANIRAKDHLSHTKEKVLNILMKLLEEKKVKSRKVSNYKEVRQLFKKVDRQAVRTKKAFINQK